MKRHFRMLVTIAFLSHAIVLFVLPRLPFLFSQDSMDLMRYGGHGAHLAMNHPAVFVLYLVPFVAFGALFFFRNWGRYVLAVYLALVLVGSFFFGVSISGPPETFFGDLALLADGATFGLAFFSPLRNEFQPP
jgi:hypothetical protein